MGAAASVHRTTAEAIARAEMSISQAISIGPKSTMDDTALREALRQLQLSPDTIDTVATALHAHARDPVQHPVDEHLARLCTSEYTRGALHALSWYLIASQHAHADGQHCVHSSKQSLGRPKGGPGSTLGSHHLEGKDTPEDKAGGRIYQIRPVALTTAGNTPAIEPPMNRLSTMWARMRRTRSMPTAQEPGIASTATDVGDGTCQKCAADDRRRSPAPGDPTPTTMLPPKMGVRVQSSPRDLKASSFLSGLGLGSPRSGRAPGDAASPRRAPVRTGHWKLGHEIGKGSFGAVHIGLNEDTGDLIAVKVLSVRNADAAEPLYREIELMRHLSHPNIVCYLGAEVNDGEGTISIFQEWVPGSVTTLLVNFGPFSDRRIAGYTKQILQGLQYLHEERVIHRDIKGGNILVDDRGVVKLCDFGASKMLDTESLTEIGDHTRVGSPLFMAPEILLRQEYGPQVDIWSLGGAVLEMATGHPPWYTLNLRTPVALINWVKCTDGPPPLPENLSPPLAKFLLRCFERDPAKRATAKQLLSDPFVTRRHGALLNSAASDEKSVSDIDNMSRTAAIARIRRVSCSDCSRSPPGASPRGSDATVSPRSPAGHQPLRVDFGSPRQSLSGCVAFGKLAERAGETPAKASGTSSAEARPVKRASPLRALEVVTAGLEPSSSSRLTTPPPTRRLSTGRGASSSPNPFGGRRRSFEQSPESARRASRNSIGARPTSANFEQEKSIQLRECTSESKASEGSSKPKTGPKAGVDKVLNAVNVAALGLGGASGPLGARDLSALVRSDSDSSSSSSSSSSGHSSGDDGDGKKDSVGDDVIVVAARRSSKPRKSGRGGRPSLIKDGDGVHTSVPVVQHCKQ